MEDLFILYQSLIESQEYKTIYSFIFDSSYYKIVSSWHLYPYQVYPSFINLCYHFYDAYGIVYKVLQDIHPLEDPKVKPLCPYLVDALALTSYIYIDLSAEPVRSTASVMPSWSSMGLLNAADYSVWGVKRMYYYNTNSWKLGFGMTFSGRQTKCWLMYYPLVDSWEQFIPKDTTFNLRAKYRGFNRITRPVYEFNFLTNRALQHHDYASGMYYSTSFFWRKHYPHINLPSGIFFFWHEHYGSVEVGLKLLFSHWYQLDYLEWEDALVAREMTGNTNINDIIYFFKDYLNTDDWRKFYRDPVTKRLFLIGETVDKKLLTPEELNKLFQSGI